MKYHIPQRPSCQWPCHPSRGNRNPFRERPFDMADIYWFDDDHRNRRLDIDKRK